MRKTIGKLFILALVLTLGFGLVGFGANAEKTYTFGISMPQLDNDGFKANLVGIRKFAEEQGIELVVTDAKSMADAQM